MARRYGVDTSVLVRLVAQEPKSDYERCVRRLKELAQEQDCAFFASNQVIGEAYAALTHHYGISSAEARAGLALVLQGSLVAPLNGRAVLDALAAPPEPGLFDRLIINDYEQARLETLTLDHAMASLPGVRRL